MPPGKELIIPVSDEHDTTEYITDGSGPRVSHVCSRYVYLLDRIERPDGTVIHMREGSGPT
jgi:hypothetical protein